MMTLISCNFIDCRTNQNDGFPLKKMFFDSSFENLSISVLLGIYVESYGSQTALN